MDFMSRRTVKAVSIAIAIIFLFSIAGTLIYYLVAPKYVSAATIQEQLDAAKEEKKEIQNQIDDANAKKEKTLSQKRELDNEISGLETKIDELGNKINENTQKLAEEEVKLDEATTRAEQQYSDFKSRFRTMCESGTVNYLMILLSSESLTDFVDRLEIAKEISAYDKKLFDKMTDEKNKIEESKNHIETLKNEQEQAQADLKEQNAALEQKRQESENYISELEQDIEAYKKAYAEKEAAENALKSQLQGTLSRSTGANVVIGNGEFTWPLPGYSATSSSYGWRVHPILGTRKFHSGSDIPAPTGTTIYAAAGGRVVIAGWNGGYGNCVSIDHGNGKATLYGHMSSIAVSNGQTVSKGQVIGRVGSTGMSTGAHLHFEVLINGSPTNPLQYF